MYVIVIVIISISILMSGSSSNKRRVVSSDALQAQLREMDSLADFLMDDD